MLQSRAFFLGALYSLLLMCLLRLPAPKRVLFITLAVAILAGITGIALQTKKDSTLGRLLIYKISAQMLRENVITGIGWDRFAWEYPNYQARYFERERYTSKELLLADNTKHAFNDYLEWIIETGLSGAIAMAAIAYIIFMTIRRALKRNPALPPVLLLSCSILSTILIAALFTHVFEKHYIQFVLALALLTVSYYAYLQPRLLPWYLLAGTCTLLLIIGIYLVSDSKFNKANHSFTDATLLYEAGFKKKALLQYQGLYEQLQHNVQFLNRYANTLISLGRYQEAEPLLEDLIRLDNNYSYYLKLGDCYFRNHKYAQAEATLLFAVHLVPNRFTSRYQLFKYYINTQTYDKAIRTGNDILSLPIKVPSQQVAYIREEVRSLLEACQN